MQLLITGDEDFTQGASVVKADDAEAAFGVVGGEFVVRLGGLVGIGMMGGFVGQTEVDQAIAEVEIGDILEAIAEGVVDSEGGEAAFGIETVMFEMLFDECFQNGMSSRRE